MWNIFFRPILTAFVIFLEERFTASSWHPKLCVAQGNDLSVVYFKAYRRKEHLPQRKPIAIFSKTSCKWWKRMTDVYTVYIYLYTYIHICIPLSVFLFHLYISRWYCIDTHSFMPHEAGDLEVILVLDAIGCARARRILAFWKTWDWLRNETSQVWEMVMKRF